MRCIKLRGNMILRCLGFTVFINNVKTVKQFAVASLVHKFCIVSFVNKFINNDN